jgi:hypothetical protein
MNLLKSFSLWLFTACVGIALSAEIVATVGPVPAIVISTNRVFSVGHVANPFTAANLTRNGTPYVPDGSPMWVRFVDKSGKVQEENGSSFTFVTTATGDIDRWFGTTYRPMPVEAIEPIVIVTNGQPITVLSRSRHDMTFSARVTSLYFNNGYIFTDYLPADNDSSSRVLSGGLTVGLVAAAIRNTDQVVIGSVVVIPGTDGPAVVLPPVVTPPPTSTPVPVATNDIFNAGIRVGRSNLLKQVQIFVNGLQ